MRSVVGLTTLLYSFAASGNGAGPTLTIVTENWPPNNYLSDDGKVIGHATQKVRQLLEKAGFSYTITLLPWARAYRMAQTKPNTAVYSIMRTKSREAQFQWVCPIIPATPIYIFKLAKRGDIKLSNLEDAKNYMLSVSRDEFDHHFLLAKGFVEAKDFYVSFDDKTNVRKLLNGRIEIMIGTEYALNTHVSQIGYHRQDIAKALHIPVPNDNPTCLAFSLKTPKQMVARVRKALADSATIDE